MTQAKLSPLNQRELRKLILSIEANANRLDLLLAICDDRNLQSDLIQQYETELNQRGFATYQTRLELKQPSLKATLAALAEQEPGLQAGERSVVTVVGGADLLGVRLTEATSEQEKFFFSLQWTREALREFHFPVVMWLSDAVATELSQQAQDFWSWRSGVFEFEPEPRFVATPERMSEQVTRQPLDDEIRQTGSVETLKQQIAALTQQNPQSPLLVTLYNDLGDAHRQRYAHEQALQSYKQALNLAQTLKDKAGQARSRYNLGLSLYHSGRCEQAIDFYQQSLGTYREIGDRNGEANSLNNLGNAYWSLGQYRQAIDFYQQSLAIRREIDSHYGEAISLSNLGNAYESLGQYPQAIDFCQQSLAIQREIGDRNGEAISLNNLGSAYQSLGQYPQAIDFYQQSLGIQRQIGDRNGEARSLNNLGNAYRSLGQYQRAIDFCQQSLVIQREIGDRNGEARSLNNLGIANQALGQYPQAIDFCQQSLVIQREIGDRNGEARSLGNLGIANQALGQYQRAIDFCQQQYEITSEIGDRHGEANSLFNKGLALARLDYHYEALQSFQQALAIYEDLKLDHMVEKCQKAIAERNQIIAAQRRTAPAIGVEKNKNDWWEKSQPVPQRQAVSRPARQGLSRWQRWGLWFAVGVAIVLVILWLR
jgi:tetratricopeptide (TPR) repeat protein